MYALDENLRLGESTALLVLKHFCKTVIAEFGSEYLRAPTEADMNRILKTNAARGFPGMLGSIDCMHWFWKNCPTAWSGQICNSDQAPIFCPFPSIGSCDMESQVLQSRSSSV